MSALVSEVRAALGCLTRWHGLSAGASRAALAGALALYPLVGMGLGLLATGAAAAGGGAAGIAVLLALTGPRPLVALAAAAGALSRPGDAATVLARLRATPAGAGMVAALVLLGAKTWAAVTLPPPARAMGLVCAPMLGAWAVTVQCYGGAPSLARGPAAAQIGRARFREFGWASVVALGVTLAVADAVGLVVVLAAALTTVGLRVYAHHRLGGLTGRLLAATRELVETVVLLALALLAYAGR
jgi:adenosylcobinamide-GDP ribazoletransferase